MASTILLVDDQRDILRLLHSTLDTLKNKELDIIEAPSGEEALLKAGRRKIDLLITDYLLPGINGVELMHKVQVRNPDVQVILITGKSDRKAREEMLDAGANAIFDKPIPLADFLDMVQRSLGLVRTIFPPESNTTTETGRARLADLLANFCQEIKASAVFLINDRGLVVARAGNLHDSSMEVSLVSALTAIANAGLKVAKFNHQEALNQYSVFTSGDHHMLLIPVDASHSLLLAGTGIANRGNIFNTLEGLVAVRDEVDKSLRSIGVTAEPEQAQESHRSDSENSGKTGDLPASFEMEALLKEAGKENVNREEVDAFWKQAAEKNASMSTNPEGIPYEEARKLGLTPNKK